MSDWKTVRVRELCSDIIDCVNKTAPISDTSTKYKMLRTSDVRNGFINLENLNCVTEETFIKWTRRGKLQVGDVILTREAPLGEVGIVRCAENYFLGQRLVLFRANPAVCDNRFLLYAFQFHDNKQAIISKGVGATVLHLRVPECERIEIKVPDLQTQKRIGDILSAYDDLIEANKKQIKLLEEAAQRLYKEWFVDLRFPGHETTPITDGIPKGWAVESILNNEIFRFVKSNVAPFDGKKQYYATADVSGTSIISAGEEVTFDKRPSRASIQPVPNSVWFARMSNSHKVLSCFGASESLSINAIISSGFAGFSSARETFGFVYATIASEFFDGEKNRYATGATQVSLTNEGLKNIKVLIPEYSIVVKYSKCVEPLLLKEEALKRQIKLLCEARDRLLPKLMKGEVEV